jgi:DNA-binding NtrC family response regulator
VEAVNGQEALERLNDPSAAIDLILSDVRMPVMDGWELTGAIARSRPTLPVVLMSGHSTTFSGSSFHPLLNFLPKPFPNDRLLSLLQEVLRSDLRSI